MRFLFRFFPAQFRPQERVQCLGIGYLRTAGRIGESGKLELAIVGDSAKIMLGVRVGETVVVKW